MPHSFLAFIDEAGDDGFAKCREPGKNGGSSHWLVLSACIIRKTNSLEATIWRDEILQKIQKDRRYLHFKDLDHSKRVVAAQCLSEKPVRITSVLASKRFITGDIYKKKNQLYFYMARYLIERVSWLCHDLRSRVPEGNGQVAIIFSRRGGMSYDEFRSYLHHLKSDAKADVRIHWPVIDIDSVTAHDHSRIAALQLVDIAASSFLAAVEPNLYGDCEGRYAGILKPRVYSRDKKFLSYGLKFLPGHEHCELSPEQAQIIEVYK